LWDKRRRKFQKTFVNARIVNTVWVKGPCRGKRTSASKLKRRSPKGRKGVRKEEKHHR